MRFVQNCGQRSNAIAWTSDVRRWKFYVGDMLLAARKIQVYTEGLDRDEFLESDLRFDAVLRNLEVMGEAATHVPDDVRVAHAEVPWRKIVATRNRLIHAYLGVDGDIVWSIVRDDIPPLVPLLERLVDS